MAVIKKQATIKKIAALTDTSEATVSKALNHCVGMDVCTKSKIIKTADELNYTTPQIAKTVSKPKIAVILPQNPQYFWNQARKGIVDGEKENKDLYLKLFIYSSTEHEVDFLFCLESAKEFNPDLYIIVPVSTQRAEREIGALQVPVIFLNEALELPGCCFVGADAAADGKNMADACSDLLKKNPRMLVINTLPSGKIAGRRAEAFLKALPKTVQIAGTIQSAISPMLSSRLARELNKRYKDKFDCIFVAQGILPQVCLALKKLHLNTPCIGFESPVSNQVYLHDGTIAAVLSQDVRQQSHQAVVCAAQALTHQKALPDKVTFTSKIILQGVDSVKKLKLGVFGAGRGRYMVDTISQYEGVELVAICDKYRPALEGCGELAEKNGQKVALYEDFEEFIKHDMDAVILANYAHEHAPYAIRLLESGRHVASEVLPTNNMAEAVALVEAVERSGKVYAYLENYCYFPATTEMRRLYKEGVLGKMVHAEGEYIHDCESIWHLCTYGERNHWRNLCPSTFYCTHSLGPIVHISGCRPVRVIGIEAPPSERTISMGRTCGEVAMEIIQMDNGATVKSIHGELIREPSSIWYSVYGSKGMAENNRWEGWTVETVNLYEARDGAMKSYKPTPMNDSELAKHTAGHGGSDFYTIHYFIQKILGKPEGAESIDVYEALDMSMPGLLAYRSICNGNAPMDVPNFRNKEEREPYRNDTWSVWGEGENKAPVRVTNIPDEIYERVKQKWEESQKKG